MLDDGHSKFGIVDMIWKGLDRDILSQLLPDGLIEKQGAVRVVKRPVFAVK